MKDFIQKYWRFAAGLLIVAGVLSLSLSGILTPFVHVALNPLVATQRWVATRYNAIYQLVSSPGDMAAIRAENDRLKNENETLRGQLIQLEERLKQAEVTESLLGVARARPDSNYVAAIVIGRDTNPFMRYVIIDQGSDAGLRRGMPVLTAQGLVGRIDAVTASAARVQLVTDPDSAVNVRLPNSETDGILVGSVTGDINLEMISQEAELTTGELILTSGLGGTYPSNILVGQVATVRKVETDLFQGASVQPVVDFNNLSAVLVVSNFRPVDISPLTEAP